jgi:hypothetical protein
MPQLDKAAALWQQVSDADPDDAQAAAKVRELAARQTLAAIKFQMRCGVPARAGE